ncbi:hypothetical protein H2203_001458 [Taxawa tesnikishii (nom. ined.)]|nr:hypothetical protein H2203_001458 [Dothideales sp. JES 119]
MSRFVDHCWLLGPTGRGPQALFCTGNRINGTVGIGSHICGHQTSSYRFNTTGLRLDWDRCFASEFLALHETRWSWNPTNILIISSVATALLAMLITLNMPIREPSWPREGISRPFTHPTNQLRSPEDNLTLWQWMSISWMSPLISTGSKRQLHDEDVWLLGYEFQHRHLHDAFRELKGTVIKRLLRANWIDLGLLTALAILELAANYSAPVLLQQLLRAMEQARVTKRPAITYAVLMLVVRLVAAQSAVFSLWFGRRCYERSRGEMITMLYEKTLNRKIVGAVQDDEKDDEVGAGEDQEAAEHLLGNEEDEGFSEDEPLLNGHSKGASGGKSRIVHYLENVWRWLPWSHKKEVSEKEHKQPASMGKILNLMRNDVYEVAQRFWEFQTLVNKPLGLIVSLVLVWRLIGWPCLLGVAVVLVAQVLNALLARILIGWERVRRQATDGKLQQISQYVEAIRHLRWYGWTYSWLDKIMEAREKELNLKVITYLWNIAIIFTNTLANGALPVVAFYAYTALAGQELRVDVAFPALQLFSMLQSNLKEIPGLITVLLNASVAVGRIEDFMSEPDKAENDDVVPRHTEELAVENASFAWPATARNVLHNVSLSSPLDSPSFMGRLLPARLHCFKLS